MSALGPKRLLADRKRVAAFVPTRTFGERSPVLTVRPAQTSERSSGTPLSSPKRIGVQNPGILDEQVRDLVLGYNGEITFQRHQLAEWHLSGIRRIRKLHSHCKPWRVGRVRTITPPWQASAPTDRVFARARIEADRLPSVAVRACASATEFGHLNRR